ncbi:MAG: CehA/McbA family metallohydrolase [Limisphaerales bacterium]
MRGAALFVLLTAFMAEAANVSVERPRWLNPYTAKEGDEELIFTPPGFDKPGKPAIASGGNVARLRILVTEVGADQPSFCRINVVGSDGNYYQPQKNRLTPYSLTGQWPKTLAGNRPGKAPIRYLGRFFYSNGETDIYVPPGNVRIEVWKGFEYEPKVRTVRVRPGENRGVVIELSRAVDMTGLDMYSGDTHLHFDRITRDDDETILDLMAAEDVRYGYVLCYNGTGSYDGRMSKQDIPQRRGLGTNSVVRRGNYQIMSAQEYRSGHFGHTKVFLSDQLVQAGKSYDPNGWPVFGEAVRSIREAGGLVFWAHGGYSKEIFADYVLGTVDGMELMQFGIYRPIGLEGWYKILNIGFRFPSLGASDFPACRKLADCRTYVISEEEPTMEEWLRGAAAGRSFFTTGPLMRLRAGDSEPGDIVRFTGEKKTVTVTVGVRSLVAPVSHIDLIVNGRVAARETFTREASKREWLLLEHELELSESSWVAAAAYSLSATGNPDAEAHTNPVYFYRDHKAPYNAEDLAWLLQRLEGRIEFHENRKIAVGKEKVLAYFEKARQKLLQIRRNHGQRIE